MPFFLSLPLSLSLFLLFPPFSFLSPFPSNLPHPLISSWIPPFPTLLVLQTWWPLHSDAICSLPPKVTMRYVHSYNKSELYIRTPKCGHVWDLWKVCIMTSVLRFRCAYLCIGTEQAKRPPLFIKDHMAVFPMLVLTSQREIGSLKKPLFMS